MKFFQWSKDGGPESNVDGFFLVEIKGLFSIALLKFNKGKREAFHSHAFNALSIYLKSNVVEETLDVKTGAVKYRKISKPTIKFTPKEQFHRIRAVEDSWCLTFRGAWDKVWYEYEESTGNTTTLTNGRVVVDTRAT